MAWVSKLIRAKQFTFKCQDFNATIAEAMPSDIIYCDPPYIDRHVDYYNGWNDEQERELFDKLSSFTGKFVLSTWHHNDYRENDYVKSLWSQYKVLTCEHFYHVGGKETNRSSMVEALIINFNALPAIEPKNPAQSSLFDVHAIENMDKSINNSCISHY